MILKANELRRGQVVYDSKNKLKWFVKHVGEFIVLKGVEPPMETGEAPVRFSTTWRVKPTSDLLFMEVEDAV